MDYHKVNCDGGNAVRGGRHVTLSNTSPHHPAGFRASGTADAGFPPAVRQRRGKFAPCSRGVRLPFLALLLCPLAAQAADNPPTVTWEQYGMVLLIGSIVAIVGLANGILSIWDRVKPKPPLRDQFSPLVHDHAQYLKREEHDRHMAACLEERRHTLKHDTINRETLQRQIDHLGETIRTEFAKQERANEERASDIHARVNAISEPLNQMIGKFENHMESHRQGELR